MSRYDDIYGPNGRIPVSIGETSAHDRYMDPPDDPGHCDCCEKNQQRVTDLEEMRDWVAEHTGRITFLAHQNGPWRVMLLPNDGTVIIEAPTQGEALEKLWREHT